MEATETRTWVGNRIKQAREHLGLSQVQLARRFGKTQTAISYWENGKRTPSLDDLLDIARALGQGVSYFLPPVEAPELVRSLIQTTADRLELRELGTDLQAMVDVAERSAPLQRKIAILASRPAAAAQELLAKADVVGPPVDVEELAQRCAVTIIRSTFGHPLLGAVITTGEGAVIAINEPSPGESRPRLASQQQRQRFFIAHQLGHYLLGHHDRVFLHFSLSAEDGNPPEHDPRHESEANEFAAELLLPADFVRGAVRAEHSVESLAATFEVSPLAMAYRLIDLGLR